MTLEQALSVLQNPAAQARVRAVRWLRVLGGERAVAALIGALDDPDPNGAVPHYAVTALGEMQAREAVPILIERVQSDCWAMWRRSYIDTLGQIGDPPALPLLVGALDDPEEQIVKAACSALSRVSDPEAIEPLLRLLDDPRWLVRQAACEALFELKVTDERLSAALEELALPDEQDSPAPQIHALNLAALEAIERCDTALGVQPRPRRASAELEKVAQEAAGRTRRRYRWMSEEVVRRRVGDGNGEADGPAEGKEEVSPEELEDALAELRESDPRKRWRAVRRLGGLGGAEAIAALVSALEDTAADVRSQAAFSLSQRKSPEAVTALIQHLLGDESADVCGMCAWQLADERLVSVLEKLARDPEADEHDLEVLELNGELGWRREMAVEMGDPEPQPRMTMADMVEQARQLLAQEGA
jgi:HEAT repeat protein